MPRRVAGRRNVGGSGRERQQGSLPLIDQSQAQGKGTSIEMITTGMTMMRQNDASAPHCHLGTYRMGPPTKN